MKLKEIKLEPPLLDEILRYAKVFDEVGIA